MKYIFNIILLLAFTFNLIAQPTEKRLKILVAPDHADWNYKIGEKVKFNVMVILDGNLVPNAKIIYEVGPEKMPFTTKDSTVLAKGQGTINGGTMSTNGFLRCSVTSTYEGRTYRNLATAGFEPLSIKPVVEVPSDFLDFWNKAKVDLAKIPINAKMTLLPERCTDKVNVYHVVMQNYRHDGQAKLYGILCVPKKEGKYPALLRVPGAGIRPYSGDVFTAEKGIITLEIGIHGIPVNMETSIYNDMNAGWLNQYWNYNLDNRDMFYYKRVYLGCIRANDFLVSLPQYDGSTLGVTGGSQGGALSVVTAALDPRVKFAAAGYPALCDMVGYTKNRAGGWPHVFDFKQYTANNTEAKMKTSAYYDVVNFAKQLKVPSYFWMGYNDETCPPTSMFAAYNSINSPKTLKLYLETGHWNFPEENDDISTWILDKIKGK